MADHAIATGPPDFVGVGAQRSGTSWWFNLLLDHPAIRPPRGGRKELHFFDRFGGEELREKHVQEYHDLFAREPGLITGEWTPRYMVDPWTVGLLHRVAPETKVLIMLRDPIERYRSGVVHRRTVGRGGRRRAAIANEAIERGRYASQLRRVFRAFPREQVLVLQYELCVVDPAAEYARTLEFLGADPYVPDDLRSLRGRTTSSGKYELWPDLSAGLHAAYDHEVVELLDLLPELDLDVWTNFRHLKAGAGA